MAVGESSALETGEIDFEVPKLGDGEVAPPKPDRAPEDLEIRWSAPMPIISDRADLGIEVEKLEPPSDGHKHRLVAIGDSLTQGFQSLAISRPWLSWPMIVAYEMGLRANYAPGGNVGNSQFTFATFPGPANAPGLPLNLESVLRAVDDAAGHSLDFKDPVLVKAVGSVVSTVANYWEHGPGSQPPAAQGSYFHNLAVWGFDVRDALDKSPAWCASSMQPPLKSVQPFLPAILDWVKTHFRDEIITSYPNQRTVIRALAGPDPETTQVTAAKWLGDDGGIETLVVALGANNALGVVWPLELHWTEGTDWKDLGKKDAFNIWAPGHFELEFGELVERIKEIKAAHVIVATVPHVTIAPLMRGVGEKPYNSRYFARYTRPWITDVEFDASKNPSLTGDEARAVDAAIDQYNYTIKRSVRDARKDGRDWYLLDMCGILDRLAYRRYLTSPGSRPVWFKPYELPARLKALSPQPDTRFFGSDVKGRTRGGLIALDGIHPTTIGYGILAQEIINIMTKKASVVFNHHNGKPRPNPQNIRVDFNRLIGLDSLIFNPPKLLDESFPRIYAIENLIDVFDLAFRKPPA